jgi:hypothetical protein
MVTIKPVYAGAVLLNSLSQEMGHWSLILCRLAGHDPMQLGAAMLHADWQTAGLSETST